MGGRTRSVESDVQDQRCMQAALRLAMRALGRTAPNPAVGAMIVDEATGEVIARGCTQPGGRPHAEAEVLALAGERARGKTMYVTLEPCSHHGRTPPCADAILQAGIARVVCPIEDPDPRVSGKGVALLRQAGVRVDLGLCAQEARWMAAGHILRMTQARPFVQLKQAVGSNGYMARGDGSPRWVTGPEGRAFAHLLRARADAILVGRQTVVDDDPELTCRLPGLAGASPIRIVLDAHFRTPATAKLIQTAERVPTLVVGSVDAPEPRFPPSVGIRRVALDEKGRLSLEAVLRTLKDEGITRLLVEAGPTIATSFYASGLVDESIVVLGSQPVAQGDRIVGVEGAAFEAIDWRIADERTIGADRIRRYRAIGPSHVETGTR